MEKKRSKGITIFSWLFLIGSLWSILGGIRAIYMLNTAGMLNDIGYLNFIISFALAGILFISAIGIHALKEWARRLILFYAAFSVLFELIYAPILSKKTVELITRYGPKGAFTPSLKATMVRAMMLKSLITTLLMVGIIIYFFTRPKVKEQFK